MEAAQHQSHRKQREKEMKADDVARYAHSPVHYAVARGDYAGLQRILSTLPRLPKAGDVTTEEESLLAEERADIVSAAIDRRDVPGRETPLHVAVRLGDADSVELLMAAGADWSLQNEHGWSALQEAVCAREDRIAMIMTRHYQPLAWAKWCRRLPRIVATTARMRDFYMEITFHFESSVIPFIGRIAPSDTYRIWKRGANLRADMTLAGFDGFRIQRSDQSFLFLGDGHDCAHGRVPPGSLLVLSHKDKEVSNALEGAGARPSDAEVAHEVALMAQTNMYRPGIDVTQAELAPHLNWRRQDRTEMVGTWKAKIYDMLRVSVSVKSRRVPGAMTDEELFAADHEGYGDVAVLTRHEKEQLDSALESEGNDDKKPWFGWGADKKTPNGNNDDVDEDSSKIVKKFSRLAPESSSNGETPKKGKGKVSKSSSVKKESSKKKRVSGVGDENKQESEYKKGLRPVLWLTPDFPLKTEEFLPLLDILANKVKAIRRMRELLTTKLPPGTFPVKVRENDCPHLLFYGPPGSGKKTLIMALLRQIFGAGAEKVKIENKPWQVQAGSRTIDVDLTTISSNHHMEFSPSDAGFQDRYVVQMIIKDMAKNRPIDPNGNKGYKVIVLNEVDKLSKEAQHSLRRTMELYSGACRIILCCDSASKVIEAVRSRCLNVRINAPSKEQIVEVLQYIAKKEGLHLPVGLAGRIALQSNRNLRRAILSFEACKVQQYPFTDNHPVQTMDWEQYVAEIASDIVNEQSPKRLFLVRGKIYELLVNCIPPEVVLKRLVFELMRKLDSELKHEVCHWAAYYEHRMHLGQKAIFHLEAFIAKFMSIYKKFLIATFG